MDLEFKQNYSLKETDNLECEHEQEKEQISSLTDILNSITPVSKSTNLVESTFANNLEYQTESQSYESVSSVNPNMIKMSNAQLAELNNHIQIVESNHLSNETNSNPNANTHTNFSKEHIQLFSHQIDKRLGNYLMDELEKKQSYIEELEEVIKFQEKEIGELKLKLDTLGKLDILAKLKSSVEGNLKSDTEDKTPHHQQDNHLAEDNKQNQLKPKVVQVKKQSTNIAETESNQLYKSNQINQMIKNAQTKNDDSRSALSDSLSYPSTNPDLVMGSSFKTKTKSIPKEEEEPRYNGVVILDKPKREPEIHIVMDYSTDTIESSEKSSDLLRQRRRARKL